MKTILLVDCQNDFFFGGALAVPNANEIKPILAKITKLAKDENIPVLKTMDCHIPNDKEFKIFPPHCIEGTQGQESIEETKIKNAIIFNKKTYNVFDKELGCDYIEKWLIDNKVTECWVAGVCTEICVLATILGLCKLGITTYVFENAIQHLKEEDEKIAKQKMRESGAMFVVAKL